MKGEHYTVHRNRAYFGILSAVFPVQTKSTPSIIVWSVILLLDLTAGVLGAYYSGLLQAETASKATIIIMIAGIIAIFWLQGAIWGLITKLFSKQEDKR